MGTAISWLFASPKDNNNGLNGFSLTGGLFNYTAEVYSTVQHEYSNDTFIEDLFLPQEYRFPSLSQSFSTLFHNDPLQRIRIIVRYARFEPSTSAPEVWCVVCFSICLFICFFMVLYLIYYNKILNDAMSSLPQILNEPSHLRA